MPRIKRESEVGWEAEGSRGSVLALVRPAYLLRAGRWEAMMGRAGERSSRAQPWCCTALPA